MLSFHDVSSNLVSEPGLLGPPVKHDSSYVHCDYDMQKALLNMRHGSDIRSQSSAKPSLIFKPPTQISPPLVQPFGGCVAEENTNRRAQPNIWPFISIKESNAVKSDKLQPQISHFLTVRQFLLPMPYCHKQRVKSQVRHVICKGKVLHLHVSYQRMLLLRTMHILIAENFKVKLEN